MANRKQRMKNRQTAKELSNNACICPECGERGKHWMSTGFQSLFDVLNGIPPEGFWVCAKFYGPDGRRIQP